MGLLDELAGKLTGQASGGGQAPLAQAVLGMLGGNGLSGLVQAFTSKGLGDVVSSWVSTGANLPVSPAQIQQALGGGQLEQVARAAGIDPATAATHLSQLLPGIVDQLTPNGSVPSSNALEEGLSALRGLLR